MTDKSSSPSATEESLADKIEEYGQNLATLAAYVNDVPTWIGAFNGLLKFCLLAAKNQTTQSETPKSDACRAALANIMARIDVDEFIPTEYKEDAMKALASVPSAIRQSSPHPAPHAAEPMVPNGNYREIQLGGSAHAIVPKVGDRVIVALDSGHLEEGNVVDIGIWVRHDGDNSAHEYSPGKVSKVNE